MTNVACGDCFVMTHDLFIRAIFLRAKFENAHKGRQMLKMRKKISNALQCRRSTFKRPGEINPLTHDDPWALSSDIEHLKKEKKCYLWVKNRLPLSKHSNFTR